MLTRVGESENVEIVQTDLRANVLRTSEESLRSILRNLSLYEEISYAKDKFESLSQKLINVDEVEVSDAKARINKCF